MERAIIRKELIKTSKAFMLCLILSVVMAVYAILRMNRLIELKGADHLWLIMLLKDNSFVDLIKWTPIFSGVVIALAQMLPEMSQKRLKLTLHLPYPQSRMILMMLAAGVVELLSIFLIQLALIYFYDSVILPSELVWRVLLTMITWYCAGLIGYVFTAAICIEGKRLRRVILALIGIAFVVILYEQPALEAYDGMLIWICLFLVCIVIVPLGSVIRFKAGLQD